MKIGIDCRIFSSKFTGIGRYTKELVDQLIKINDLENQKHTLILFFNQPEYEKFATQNSNVKKVLVNAKHYSFAEQTKFLKILNKEKLDIIHFPHFNVPFFYRRPYTVTIHDLTLSFFPGQKMTRFYHRLFYNLIIKNAVKRAKTVVAVSQNTKNDIIKHLKIKEQKIKVIHNGVNSNFKLIADQSILSKTLSKFNIKKDFLLYTGVWRSHKNLSRLIEAFAIIRNKKNLDLNLVITGNKDPYYPEVTKTIKSLNLEKNVITPGLVSEEDLINLYNAASIYVFPSLYEGFGIPPLEAMKCGTPVAASNTASIPEICGEKNAVFFDPYNTEDIAEKITTLYKDKDLQKELIERGFAHIRDFSWEKMGKEIYKIITQK
ncbi:MAG: glycosyltransferase family 1 protein [Candidatus Gracilibacteria bacterium]|jgi:glycosyltransferase involved in cell wall biosynthesis